MIVKFIFIIMIGYVNEGRKAMLKLKEQLLDEILLRRTKTSRATDIQLPPRIVKVRYDYLDEKEEDFYQALYTQSQVCNMCIIFSVNLYLLMTIYVILTYFI